MQRPHACRWACDSAWYCSPRRRARYLRIVTGSYPTARGSATGCKRFEKYRIEQALRYLRNYPCPSVSNIWKYISVRLLTCFHVWMDSGHHHLRAGP